jgi:AP-3 complex subunit mu
MIVNPLFAFSFLESFLETLQDYLGDVTETAIKDNFDIVYMVSLILLGGQKRTDADQQLVEEMLDEGHPMTMESAMLKEIVLPPTLMRKLLNVAGVSG